MNKEIIVPQKLKEAIENNNLIFFVGAGCSMTLKLPSWKKLIEDILQELITNYGGISVTNFTNILSRVESGNKSLFDALNLIEKDVDHGNTFKIKSKEFINVYIEEKSKNLPKESLIHDLLWKISQKIITTNYDKVIEKYIPNDLTPKIFDNTNAFQGLRSQQSDSEFLYKIHGDYEKPESIILFESDYKDIYKNDNYNNDTLSTHFKDKTLLFIGFSLSDPFVNDLFLKIKSIYNGHTINNHFVFTTKNEDFIEYDVTPIQIGDWDESLLNYLKNLEEIKSNIPPQNNNSIIPINTVRDEELTNNDVTNILELIDKKTNELLNNPSDKKLSDEIKDLRNKLNQLLFGKIDYLQ